MRFRRALLLILSVCLLLSQQAALAHGITHIHVDDSGRSVATRTSIESLSADHHDDFCIECLAFAQVTGAAHGCPVLPAIEPPVAIAPAAAADCHVDRGVFLHFQARAPPLTR
jgi:hypothetical protein